MMKRTAIIAALVIGIKATLMAQTIALKTNALYLTTTSLNASIETSIGKRTTLEVLGAYNPWTFQDDKKMKFWLVQPELRLWTCERYEGTFWGIHLHGAQYFGGFKAKRYDGYLAGAGISYGRAWMLSPHWNVEAELGVGYAHLWYKQSNRLPCLKDVEHRHRNYFGPTRVSLSAAYLF